MIISPKQTISLKAMRDLLAPIIARHPQAKAICGNRDPADVPVREQIRILSDYFGGHGSIDKALNEKFPGIGWRMKNWLLSRTTHPRVGDIMAVAEFWRKVDGEMFLSLDYPLPRLADIINHHPQAKALFGHESPENISLKKQLRILSDYFGGCRVIEHALGKKIKGIGGRVGHWLSEDGMPRKSDMMAVANFWAKVDGEIFLSFDHPMQSLADIINSYPNAAVMCGDRNASDMPLIEQVRILQNNFAGYRTIGKSLDKKFPSIGNRMKLWIDPKCRPRKGDIMAAAGVWDKISKGEYPLLSKPSPWLSYHFGFGKKEILRHILPCLAERLRTGEIIILPSDAQKPLFKSILPVIQTPEGRVRTAQEVKAIVKRRSVLMPPA